MRQGVLRAELVDGVHVYDETEVRQTITTSRHRSAMVALGGATGDVAALVFKELDAGLNAIEIVKNHSVAPAVVKTLVGQYLEFRNEVTINADELSSLREQLRLAVEFGPSRAILKPLQCMVCGRAHRVRACAACLAGPEASIERRTVAEAEQVRFVVEDTMGKSCVSDWTPTLCSPLDTES